LCNLKVSIAGKIVLEVNPEITRLLEEDLVEHSISTYSSFAFLSERK
jgi:hypothetical protein